MVVEQQVVAQQVVEMPSRFVLMVLQNILIVLIHALTMQIVQVDVLHG